MSTRNKLVSKTETFFIAFQKSAYYNIYYSDGYFLVAVNYANMFFLTCHRSNIV